MEQRTEAALYEEALQYWPCRDLIARILSLVDNEYLVPRDARLIDKMCGPGYLLGQIQKRRPDVVLFGLDNDRRYIEYGSAEYKNVSFIEGDVLTWHPEELFDVVLCTGALHHVIYEEQSVAIANIANSLKPCGLAIISDCYIDDWTSEEERKLAALRLGDAYTDFAIRSGASNDVIDETLEIQRNDVLGKEFKTSVRCRMPVLQRHFQLVRNDRIWPIEWHRGAFGDYLH